MLCTPPSLARPATLPASSDCVDTSRPEQLGFLTCYPDLAFLSCAHVHDWQQPWYLSLYWAEGCCSLSCSGLQELFVPPLPSIHPVPRGQLRSVEMVAPAPDWLAGVTNHDSCQSASGLRRVSELQLVWLLPQALIAHTVEAVHACQADDAAPLFLTRNHSFFTESGDGALVMKVPGDPTIVGCVTTPNSAHCRTELRRRTPAVGIRTSQSTGCEQLLAVQNPGGSTVIGQVHIDDSLSTKPVAELYYTSTGHIYMGVEQTRAGGNQVLLGRGGYPDRAGLLVRDSL